MEEFEGMPALVVLYTDLQLVSLFLGPYLTLSSITSTLLHHFGVLVDRLNNSGQFWFLYSVFALSYFYQ